MNRFNGLWMSHFRMFFTLAFIALLVPAAASAQEPKPPRVGGHVGIAFPIVTRSDGRTTTISEDFIVGFPVGITIRNSSPIAFDFEFVPTINNSPRREVTLTVHPGAIYTASRKTMPWVSARRSTSARTHTASRRSCNAVGSSKAIPSVSSRLISPCAFGSNRPGDAPTQLRSPHISGSPSNSHHS